MKICGFIGLHIVKGDGSKTAEIITSRRPCRGCTDTRSRYMAVPFFDDEDEQLPDDNDQTPLPVDVTSVCAGLDDDDNDTG